MKKFLLLLSVFAFCAQGIDAKPITVDQAMNVAKHYVADAGSFKASNANMKLNYVGRSLKGMADFYVFNREGNNGFVIVAGDDASTPVLGYSNSGSFDINEAPEPMRDMLKAYQSQMEWLRMNPQASKTPRFTYDLQPYGVYPICGEVHWHQFPPYNNNCPTAAHALTSNGRCYAGCTTVALATIMKGLRHPSIGFGENSYTVTIDGREVPVSAKFNDYTYRYGQMKNGYGENAYNAQDVSVTSKKLAVFVDGEFWHGENWEQRKAKLKKDRDYWIEKIEENMARDRRNDEKLRALGWTPLHFWEKEVFKRLDDCVVAVLLAAAEKSDDTGADVELE